MPNIDYAEVREKLAVAFLIAESAVQNSQAVNRTDAVQSDLDTIFASNTQAYREVLLGCVLAKLANSSIDISKPYIAQSEASFNGRSLDERVVNPFLHEKRVPSSKGAYLSTFRRSVDFSLSTRAGVRDKVGYDALLHLIRYVEESGIYKREDFLIDLLIRFVQIRERSFVPIAKLNRVSLTQYARLIDGLMGMASGGRIPVMLITAMFRALSTHFDLGWEIESQGINEADAASGAGGDITIRKSTKLLLVAEITERIVDKSRVISTFNSKISPEAIDDYIFFVNTVNANALATDQAEQYFAQGSEVNFVDIKTWLNMSLATLGKDGRSVFNSQLRSVLDSDDTPRSIKVGWNDLVAKLTSL
jgi:hypothetical protein